MTIWRMRIACWISKAISSISEYVTLIPFPLQQWLYERATMLRHTYNSTWLVMILASPAASYTSLYQTRWCSVYHPDSNMGGEETVSHTVGESHWSCYCLLASRLRLDWTVAVCLSTLRDRHRLGGVFCEIGGCLFRNWEAI